MLNASSDYKTARTTLDTFISQTFLKQLSKQLQEAIETGESLGRSVIVEKDRVLSKREPQALFFVLAAADDRPIRIAFDLIPKEALDYIRYKALTIAGVEHEELRRAVKDAIDKAIREGKTFREFRAEIDQLFDSFGVTRLSNQHIATVYRTNVFTAYSVGAQAQVDTMRDRFPMWRYSAIKDSRTRPDHKELDGRIFRVGEGPVPPIDYNCRCTAIYLHISLVRKNITAEEWIGSPGFVRFNSQHSFEEWKAKKPVPPEIQNWVNNNL